MQPNYYYQCQYQNSTRLYTYHAEEQFAEGEKAEAIAPDGVPVTVEVRSACSVPSFATKPIHKVGALERPVIGHNNPPDDLDVATASINERLLKIEADIAKVLPLESEQKAGEAAALLKLINHLKKEAEDTHKQAKEPHLRAGQKCDKWKAERLADIEKRRAKLEAPLNEYLQAKAEEERLRLLEEAAKREAEVLALAAQAKAQADLLLNEAADSENIAETAQELFAAAEGKAQEAQMLINHAANAKPQELVKARAAFGAATASSSDVWVGELESVITIDLEALRHYLGKDDIEKAIARFVKAGGRELRGAKIYTKSKLNIR